MFIVENSGITTSCAWLVIPRLIHVEIRNFTALAAGVEDAATVPAPAGRAVYSTIQGMAQAVRLGARLHPQSAPYLLPTGFYLPSTDQILQTLIADGVKAALTEYTEYCGPIDRSVVPECSAVGVTMCNSQNRTVQQHWRFGDEHFLGIPAIVLSLGFGSFALYVVWKLRNRPRVKGVDLFKVVDGFKMGLDTTNHQADWMAQGFWDLRDGKVVAQALAADWSPIEAEEEEEEEYVPLRAVGSLS